MTDNTKEPLDKNERILSFKQSQEFTEAALKAVSGAYQMGDLTYIGTCGNNGFDHIPD